MKRLTIRSASRGPGSGKSKPIRVKEDLYSMLDRKRRNKSIGEFTEEVILRGLNAITK